MRVVVDSSARLPLDAKVIDSSTAAHTVLAVTGQAPREKCSALEERGVEVLTLPDKDGRVDLAALMKNLAGRELVNILVEGGGTLNYSLLEASLVDKLYIFIAPLLIGGRASPTPFAGAGIKSLEQAWPVRDIELKQFDRDLLIIGYPVMER